MLYHFNYEISPENFQEYNADRLMTVLNAKQI